MTALADAHIDGQARLRAAAERGVGIAWDQLAAYNAADVTSFVEPAVATVLATQRASITLTNAFLWRTLGRRPTPVDVAAILAAVRPGVTPQEVYRRPFVTACTDLKDGRPFADAIAAARERAQATAALDVQLAMRQTLVTVGEREGAILGYRRVPDADACPFCRLVAGQRYTTDQLMPVHNRCGCGVDVITEANRGDFTGNTDHDLSVTRDDLTAAVVQHGELGPLLVDGAHHFTSQSDLA